ncbi:unnamed protein product [Hermetia illucens]|uniref:G-protein coupled receptors family 1 profile domain-containing protein n=1 Tax=Hermetia illucens TaxID=343691 RepID=A0A7R8V397_HERIL|nr:opsin Rh1-like [Hermetia illucens]CAD7092090.1 unnamed protein product [Hermetia illucens]
MASFAMDPASGPRFAALGGNSSVVDKVTPDMIHLVDPYWYQWPPMDPMWNMIFGLLLTIIGIIAVIGNGVVLYIFSTTKSLRTPANLLVMNLAFCDMCIMLTNNPMMIINLFYETWVLGPMMCDVYALCGSIFGAGSIWSMSMIALDRYNVIVKGINGRPMTIKLALLKILFIWCIGAFWTIMPMIGWNRYIPEGNMTACGIDYLGRDWSTRLYVICYPLCVYYTPLFLICYSYWFILQAVSAHEKAMREQAKKMNVKSLRSSEDAEKSAEAKLAKVALTTISLWFFAWTPYLIINYCGLFKYSKISPLTTILGGIFAKTSAVYNPIVYGISHPKYRLALKEKCPCCVFGKVEKDQPADNQSQATAAEAEKA